MATTKFNQIVPLHLSIILLLLLLALPSSLAHFQLTYPPTIGFDDSIENTSPCGGFDSANAFGNATDYHIQDNVIAVLSTHPEAEWYYRVTPDRNGLGNYTDLFPVVVQQSIGKYCIQGVQIPVGFVGSSGVMQVVQHSTDGGLLFQCAAVNFVSGPPPSIPSQCTNATGVQASFTTDAAFVSAVTAAASSSSSSSGGSGGATTTGAQPSSTQSSAAGSSVGGVNYMGQWTRDRPLYQGTVTLLGVGVVLLLASGTLFL